MSDKVVEDNPTALFSLQTWIPPRTVEAEGYWRFDMGQVFRTLSEAQVTRWEFHSEQLTRIVRLELCEREVVETHDGRAIKQARLFKTTDI